MDCHEIWGRHVHNFVTVMPPRPPYSKSTKKIRFKKMKEMHSQIVNFNHLSMPPLPPFCLLVAIPRFLVASSAPFAPCLSGLNWTYILYILLLKHLRHQHFVNLNPRSKPFASVCSCFNWLVFESFMNGTYKPTFYVITVINRVAHCLITSADFPCTFSHEVIKLWEKKTKTKNFSLMFCLFWWNGSISPYSIKHAYQISLSLPSNDDVIVNSKDIIR